RPYVIYSEASAGNNPLVKRFNGTTWEMVGTGAIAVERGTGLGIAIDQTDNTVFVTFVAGTGSTGAIRMYSFNGTSWTDIPFPNATLNGNATTGSVLGARHTSIALDGNNNPFISYSNGSNSLKATVIKYNRLTSEWTLSGIISTRDASWTNISRSLSGNLYT